MSNYNPPPFVDKIRYKNCQQINDPITRKRVYLTPDGESLPSVTTILGATKDMTHLIRSQEKQQVLAQPCTVI